MDDTQTSTHTYSVEKTTHHVPAIYWLNKHVWFDDYERVKSNPEWFDTDKYTITDVRFDLDQTPIESPHHPDGRSIWLTIRSDYEMEFPSDHPHHAVSLEECSESETYVTKTATILEHLGYDYSVHAVLDVGLDENNDGLHITVCERVKHPTK